MPKQQYQVPFDQKSIQQLYPNYSHQQFISLLNDQKIDRALGCMFGAFIGDALGAFLQFNNNINQKLLNQAMQMQGGGTFNLRAGQVTDDSELSFHLFYGLTKYNPQRTLNQQTDQLIVDICLQYLRWKKSKPFDIGYTCINGINVIQEYKDKLLQNKNTKQVLEDMLVAINAINCQSQSNGSLMRITPLAFFLSLVQDQGSLLVQKQIKLLHPNIYNVAAGKIWVQLLKNIIKRKNNHQLKEIYDKALLNAKQNNLSEWVSAVDSKQPINAKVNIGWSKIAWSYGLRILRLMSGNVIQSYSDKQYVSYVKEIIGRGGDTDTNACIVGGMIGAIIGFKKLPSKYVSTLMNLTFTQELKKKNDRNHFYEPKYFFSKAYWFIQKINNKGPSTFPQPKLLVPQQPKNQCNNM